MRKILFAMVILFTASSAHAADDCDHVNEEKVCWDSGSSITLSWAYSSSTVEGYQIEVRDFDWLGSVLIRVTRNSTVKEGVISEGDSYIFDFADNSGFEGIKIVAIKVSNINTMPNIGIYPYDPQAKIIIKQFVVEKKKPSLGIEISAEGEARINSRIAAHIEIKNSGDADLLDTELVIYFGDLKSMKEYDMYKGLLIEDTMVTADMLWENTSTYRLTPFNPGILSNGFLIKILNFSNKSAFISASYSQSTKNGTLIEGGTMLFDFTRGKEYRGVRILGTNISSSAVEFVLQFPRKNSLKQRYPVIFKGRSESVKLGFLIPVSSKKSFSIAAYASGKDDDGNIYNTTKSATIPLSKMFSIRKSASDSILRELYTESYYRVGNITTIKNITHVNIRVDNFQSYPVYGIRLEDGIPPGFNFVEDANITSISWNFDLNANSYREFTYGIIAKKHGVYTLPKATLTWNWLGEEVREESNAPRTTVHAPYIRIDRGFNKNKIYVGDKLQVTLSITNIGDLSTDIEVNDTVPQNTTFISGTSSYSGFLNPGESANIVYNLSILDAGTIEFQSPVIISKNQGFEWYAPLPVKEFVVLQSAPSALPSVTITQDTALPEQVHKKGLIQIINEKIPLLEGAMPITMLIFSILLLLILHKINNN